jgi:hypothetical protein
MQYVQIHYAALVDNTNGPSESGIARLKADAKK